MRDSLGVGERRAYLVINICDVHHKVDLELEIIPQYSPYNIRRYIVPSMAQVGIVVDRRATSVPADTVGLPIYGNEQVFGASERVPYFYRRQWWFAVRPLRGLPGRLLPYGGCHCSLVECVNVGFAGSGEAQRKSGYDIAIGKEGHQQGLRSSVYVNASERNISPLQ